MTSNFEDVGRFHRKFGLPAEDWRAGKERDLPEELLQFRIKFLEEELEEFKRAAAQNDHVEMFDALLDIVYVAMGTAHLANYPWEAGWNEVQSTNMAKVRAQHASESKRGTAFDVVKPEGWVAPDLRRILDWAFHRCQECHRDLPDEAPRAYFCSRECYVAHEGRTA